MSAIWIDLHLHSTASDGTNTPTELVEKAVDFGLHALALTDHDTIDGLAEAEKATQGKDILFVRGCEVAAEWLGYEFHFLGYFLPYENVALQSFLQETQRARNERNEEIIQRLRTIGFDVALAEVETFSRNRCLGRPHIAQLLLKKGYVHSLQEAFSEYIGLDGKAYVPRKLPSIEEMLATFKKIDATVAWAHPCLTVLSKKTLTRLAGLCADWGLHGLEAFHSSHYKNDINWCTTMAKRHGFLLTGGSDYHGEVKAHVDFGRVGTGEKIAGNLLVTMMQKRLHKGLWVPDVHSNSVFAPFFE